MYSYVTDVEFRLKAGVKESDMSYQFTTSRQELYKAISEYTPERVKGNLKHLRGRLERHFVLDEQCLFQARNGIFWRDPVNLRVVYSYLRVQIAWHSMQSEFLKQIDHYQQLMSRCYPDPVGSASTPNVSQARLRFLFTSTTIQKFFEELAQLNSNALAFTNF